MSQITVKNISSGTVILSMPDINFRRELIPGRVIPISQEEYNNLIFDPGVDTLVQGHYIEFSGIEAEQAVSISETPVFDVEKINKMLNKLNITAFANFIPTAMDAEKETVVKMAIEKGITNPAFVALIKKYCGVDIIEAININHQLKT